MLKKIYLNNDWEFTEKFSPSFKTFKADKTLKKVRLPHTVAELPYNYVDEKDYEMVSGYRRTFKYDRSFDNKRVFLNFDGAAHVSTVYFNNKRFSNISFNMNFFILRNNIHFNFAFLCIPSNKTCVILAFYYPI